MEAAKNLFAIVLVVVVLGGGYVGFRYWQSGEVMNRSFEERARFAPTKCYLESSGFSSAMTSFLYTANGYVREEFYTTVQGKSARGHIIVTPDGMGYIWYDGVPTGYKLPYGKMFSKDEGMFENLKSCEPWWSPNDSYFQLPALVDFEEVSAIPS